MRHTRSATRFDAAISPPARRASIETTLLIGFGVLLVVGLVVQFVLGGVWDIFSGFKERQPAVECLTAKAIYGPFMHTVLERGEVESSSNVEVRCEVESRNSGGTNILEIVPEGTWVNQGDFLVKLDDSALQTQLIQQQIVCSNSESAVIEAQATFDSAKLALSEYAEGTFVEQLEQQQSEVFVAEENMRRAEEYIEYSKRLAERGYIPEAQLEADAFAVEKARKELGVAETKLKVLQSYTKQKMLMQLNADIKTAEARLQARLKTAELDDVQLLDIERQIAKCTITAPVHGQVVYANGKNRSTTSTILIEEGQPVRERQVIINLPDPKKMRVVANVHESRIGDVMPGLEAELMLDAMPDLALSGRVTQVSEYPLPAISVYMAHVKEYAVAIEIDEPPNDLRPGMTAEVNIVVERIDNALQVPIEAVVERNSKFFCAVPDEDGRLQVREVTVGSANETHVTILSGIQVDDEVVLNLGDEAVMALLDLPVEEAA